MQINDVCELPAVELPFGSVEWNGRLDLMAGGWPLDIFLVKAAVWLMIKRFEITK